MHIPHVYCVQTCYLTIETKFAIFGVIELQI